LANRREVSEEGVVFSSHVDGARHRLTPENVVSAQMRMGVDIAMCLDECPPYPCSETEARDMMERTLRWAATGERGLVQPGGKISVSHESVSHCSRGHVPGLEERKRRRTVELDLPGYALGGLSVGSPGTCWGP
jgi:queuine tRNA-ribosyltransferase